MLLKSGHEKDSIEIEMVDHQSERSSAHIALTQEKSFVDGNDDIFDLLAKKSSLRDKKTMM